MLCALILYLSDVTVLSRLRDFSWKFYLHAEFLPEICLEEIDEEILFVFYVWYGARTLALSLISQHTTQCNLLTLILSTIKITLICAYFITIALDYGITCRFSKNGK